MDPWNVYANENVTVGATGSGSLDRLTFAIKDVFDIKGHTCSAGNPDWLRTHRAAEQHASVVERLLRNGARLSGTTITDELMFSINGENVHYGTPVNPAAPGRIPGGSSSGSAVAVAAKLADFSIGTDTGGSIRVPSSYCGIYGIRPSHGAVSTDGLIPLAPGFDTVGWMARDAKIMLDVGQVLLGNQTSNSSAESSNYAAPDAVDKLLEHEASTASAIRSNHTASDPVVKPLGHESSTPSTVRPNRTASDPGNNLPDHETSPMQSNETDLQSPGSSHGFTRLLIAEDMWALADEPTKAALAQCLPALSGMVLQGESASVADVNGGLNEWKNAFRIIQGYEIWREHGDWITQTDPSFGSDIGDRFRWASTIGTADLQDALIVQQAAILRMSSLLDERTVLVAPTVPSFAPLKNGNGDEIELRRQMTFQLCCVAGLSGLPQVTMPIAGENGLPVGLSFLAARGRDLNLLQWLVAVSEQLPER